jgi:hypothetical protein
MGRCSPTASWLPHAPARQENVGGKALEQDDVVWLRWSGKSTTRWEASPRWVGAQRPMEEERGRLVRSGDSEPVAETGVEAVASLPTDSRASGMDKMQGRRGPFVLAQPEDGRDSKDGSTCAWSMGQLGAMQRESTHLRCRPQ